MTKIRTHYDNLKVARDAPDAVIRAAYKVLSQKYHPDKNPGDPRAAAIMSVINQSYEVLSAPARRRAHDAWIAGEELKLRQSAPQWPPIPPQWQQPQSDPPPPPRASRHWSFSLMLLPFQLLFTLFRAFPQLVLMALLVGGFWLWVSLSPRSPPPLGPKPYQVEAPAKATIAPTAKPSSSFSSISNCQEQSIEYPIFKYENGRKKFVRMGTSVVFNYVDSNGARIFSNRKPAECAEVTSTNRAPKNLGEGQYVRPPTAPNGNPWPHGSGYVHGYPIDSDNGHSKITVDNSQNDSDVFAKLVSLDDATAYPVRQFYIPQGSSFTMNKVTPGKYDLRYRDLDTGGLSRSESFEVDERRVSDGIEYSEQTITLYKVKDGNFETFELAEDEF